MLTILYLNFLLNFSFDWECLTTFPNTSKFVKNMSAATRCFINALHGKMWSNTVARVWLVTSKMMTFSCVTQVLWLSMNFTTLEMLEAGREIPLKFSLNLSSSFYRKEEMFPEDWCISEMRLREENQIEKISRKKIFHRLLFHLPPQGISDKLKAKILKWNGKHPSVHFIFWSNP